jgi:hypothetical protein
VLTAAEVNGYLMTQSVMYFATTAARDTAITLPFDGMVAYIGSNDSSEGLYTYNGTSWRKGPGWNAPWGVQLHATDTSTRSFTTAAVIPNITGSVSVVNNRYYKCTFTCRFLNTSVGIANAFNIRQGGTLIFAAPQNNYSNITDQGFTFSAMFKSTSTAAITFDVTAQAPSGTLNIYGGNGTTQLVVEDCGPYGAPV